jgi:hypothetical protein
LCAFFRAPLRRISPRTATIIINMIGTCSSGFGTNIATYACYYRRASCRRHGARMMIAGGLSRFRRARRSALAARAFTRNDGLKIAPLPLRQGPMVSVLVKGRRGSCSKNGEDGAQRRCMLKCWFCMR